MEPRTNRVQDHASRVRDQDHASYNVIWAINNSPALTFLSWSGVINQSGVINPDIEWVHKRGLWSKEASLSSNPVLGVD